MEALETKINSDHYRKGSIEVIDFIEDQQLDFCLGNVIKYICRAGHKTKDPTSDLLKAKDYIEFALKKAKRKKITEYTSYQEGLAALNFKAPSHGNFVKFD